MYKPSLQNDATYTMGNEFFCLARKNERQREKSTFSRMITKRESVDDVARVKPFHLSKRKAVCVTDDLLLISRHFVSRSTRQNSDFPERNVKFSVDFVGIHRSDKTTASNAVARNGLKGNVVFDFQLKLSSNVHDIETKVCINNINKYKNKKTLAEQITTAQIQLYM